MHTLVLDFVRTRLSLSIVRLLSLLLCICAYKYLVVSRYVTLQLPVTCQILSVNSRLPLQSAHQVHQQVHGLLVKPGAVDEWATVILWALNNPVLTKELAVAGKHYVAEKFSIEKIPKLYLSSFIGITS